MFFPERIKSVNSNDKVLEIGPGATPHQRSDEFLELKFETKEELIAQSGHVGIIETSKPVHYYDGGVFPFKDNEFDYVICSHVLEHVPDPIAFCKELQRVAKKGYIEFPTAYYDYLYNIEEHLNLIKIKEDKIFFCKKSDSVIARLSMFTDFFRQSQHLGYRFQTEMNHAWHQGYEWFDHIEINEVDNWEEICFDNDELNSKLLKPSKPVKYIEPGIKDSLKFFFKGIKRKLFG
ncbi:MAG: class I SAM-dependent methyltransferase [Crocinitomicaceae bacterium]|nr:class I SAM-dependent methyltransferase [Crocinitomicaceae bacterium]